MIAGCNCCRFSFEEVGSARGVVCSPSWLLLSTCVAIIVFLTTAKFLAENDQTEIDAFEFLSELDLQKPESGSISVLPFSHGAAVRIFSNYQIVASQKTSEEPTFDVETTKDLNIFRYNLENHHKDWEFGSSYKPCSEGMNGFILTERKVVKAATLFYCESEKKAL